MFRRKAQNIKPVTSLDDIRPEPTTQPKARSYGFGMFASAALLLLALGVGACSGSSVEGEDLHGAPDNICALADCSGPDPIPPRYDPIDTFDELSDYVTFDPNPVSGGLDIQPDEMEKLYASNTNNIRELLGKYFADVVEANPDLSPVPLTSTDEYQTNRTVDNLIGELANGDDAFDAYRFLVKDGKLYLELIDEDGDFTNGVFVFDDMDLADAVRKAVEEPDPVVPTIEYKVDLTKSVNEVILGNDLTEDDSILYNLNVQRITRYGLDDAEIENIEVPNVLYTVRLGGSDSYQLRAGESVEFDYEGNTVNAFVDELGDLLVYFSGNGTSEVFVASATVELEPGLDETVSGSNPVTHQAPSVEDPEYDLQDAELLYGVAFDSYTDSMPTGMDYILDGATLRNVLQNAVASDSVEGNPTLSSEVLPGVTLVDAILGIETADGNVGYLDGIGDDIISVAASPDQVAFEFADGTYGVATGTMAADLYDPIDESMQW